MFLLSSIIHVCYALYDATGKFSRITAASICSVFENTQEWVTIHLLHDNTLTGENREKFICLARKYGNNICFYNMEEICADVFEALREKGLTSRFSPATLYRLLAMKALPPSVKKLIYLDSDIIVNLDIRELFQEPVGKNGLAAVPEQALTYDHMVNKAIISEGVVAKDRYFNAGVLLLDMDAYGQYPQLLEDGLSFLAKHPAYDCFDQDILNYYFAKEYRQLDVHYDLFIAAERLLERKEIVPAIYHYAGEALDLFNADDVFNQLFAKYFIKTPWFDGLLYLTSCQQAGALAGHMLGNFWKACRSRRLVFCGDTKLVPQVKKHFSPVNGDKFLDIMVDDATINLNGILKEMTEQKKEKPLLVFLIDVPMVQAILPHLEKAGLKEGEDFCNGLPLLQAYQTQVMPGGNLLPKYI